MRITTRLRTLEQRAGAQRRAKARCKICGGLGKFNPRRVDAKGREPDEPPEPCPGCGKVRLLRIHVPVCERITGPPVVTVWEDP